MNTIYCKGYVKQRYPVYLSHNENFEDLFDLLPSVQNCFVVVDEKILKFFPKLIEGLRERNAYILPVACSEDNKTLDVLMSVIQSIFTLKPNRDDILVAVGGGLITNLGGLAASLIMRGINFYYVPTTLTGQIDASLGSKQAINYHGAKNWLGMYNDPEFCYVNPYFLTTKPERELNSEAVEGIKLCLATNEKLFYEIFDGLIDMRKLSTQKIGSFIEKLIRVKVAVVDEDLLEENYGMSMLYGHTIGHAIEMLDHEHISHGEGVGLGMLAAARISHILGLADEGLVGLHEEILQRLNLPTKIPEQIRPLDIYEKLAHNKKNYGGKIRFVLLKGVGRMSQVNGDYFTVVPKNVVMEAIKEGY